MQTASLNHCVIDDMGPMKVECPTTIAEVGDLVRHAAGQGQALYPLGGRTMLQQGLPPDRLGLALDLTSLKEIIDYPARDMTITVRAGITLASLRELLAQEGQRLPVDIPQAEHATLGGALAVNASGLRRHASGTLRDYVIGLSTINDDGLETKAGGRVVKNVAGYDLCKLHIGALGTLGIISQVTLKVRPLSEAQALLTVGCETDTLDVLLTLLHRSRTRPACLDVLNRNAADVIKQSSGISLPSGEWVVVVGFEDNGDTVNWQLQQIMTEIATVRLSGVAALAGSASLPLWAALVEFPGRAVPLAFKANLLPSAVAEFCTRTQALEASVCLQAHAGAGIVRGQFGEMTLANAEARLRELLTLSQERRGNVILPSCPTKWKRTLRVWGNTRDDLEVMRQVKAKFDPRGIFNPGRFLCG